MTSPTTSAGLRVALIQLAYDDSETVPERTARVVDLVRAQRGHDLVVLPELWPMGGFDYRAWPDKAEATDGPVVKALAEAAQDAGVLLHGGSIVERPADELGPEGKGLWNTSVVLSADGALASTYRKIHRFGFAGGEPLLMEAGADLVLIELPNGSHAALSTCYDLRFPELYRAQIDQGATVFLIPAAWPMARIEHWRLLLRARAIEDQALVIACNTAGTHAGTEMGGRSAVIAPSGEVLAEAGTGEEVLSVQIPAGLVESARESFPVLSDRRL
ncbi:carbon-nitrogen family hydrolase [Luteipulveratus flavus]|uniref:Carbon-nitrogen family hydrolase n=1 Tax=Luteipulveratus flavus TaxID=3031728 RepID=A0ABT6C3Y1_9MICO|nr:carbon-nitrogen family hydrolase [Luteipulveratus sp. YIM 133296]MDF8262779.1 carbon-nitrogen family hydrolase [Luteipulveratus sp. YIM 133296]